MKGSFVRWNSLKGAWVCHYPKEKPISIAYKTRGLQKAYEESMKLLWGWHRKKNPKARMPKI